MYHTEIKRRIRENGILHSVMLELTYKCNLNCFFCYNDRSLQGRQMQLTDYEKLLDDLASMQVLFVTLTGGEPLVHPDFFDIGRAARQRGFVIRIKSGGHCIAGRVARRLKTDINPFQVQISLHGATAETHEKQTRVAGSFNQLIRNIRYMQELELRPVFISTLTLWNEHEIEAMYELADSLDVRLTFQGPVGPKDDGDTEPLKIQPTANAWDELRQVQRFRHLSGVETNEVYEAPAEKDTGEVADLYCGLGTDEVMIDPFGTVYPCMHVRRSAGNLHDIDIKSIWSGSSVFPEALQLNRDAARRKQQNNDLSILDTPMYCPGLELRGCGSACNSGGCGSNVNQVLQKGVLPDIRMV